MQAFEYQAVDDRGRTRKGVLQGDTARQVRQQLREQGLAPVSVEPVSERDTRGRSGQSRIRLGGTELAVITRQLATLTQAGLTLEDALRTTADQAERGPAKRVLISLRAKVTEGHSLSSGLAEFGRTFPDIYQATVAAGEQSGNLDRVLLRLADYLETRDEMRRKTLLALIYPGILASVALLVVIGLLTYVVPQVVQVFVNMDQELPGLTQMLISLSAFLQEWGWLLGLALLAAILLTFVALRYPPTRHAWHRVVLRLPIAGRLARGMNSARFARTLSILVASGVPVLEGLKIAAGVVSNLPMRAGIERATAKVREGSSLSSALAACGHFPPMTLQLIASGEKSGKLEELLDQAAINQEREVTTLSAALMSIMEPALILTVGVLVLLIVLAILLPIFELNQIIA